MRPCLDNITPSFSLAFHSLAVPVVSALLSCRETPQSIQGLSYWNGGSWSLCFIYSQSYPGPLYTQSKGAPVSVHLGSLTSRITCYPHRGCGSHFIGDSISSCFLFGVEPRVSFWVVHGWDNPCGTFAASQAGRTL